MDFEERYKESFLDLESHVRDKYRKGIEAIRKSDDPVDCLNELDLIFKVIESSKQGTDNYIEWAGDLIKLYRNLGGIFSEILSEYGSLLDVGKKDCEELERRLQERIGNTFVGS